MNTAELVKLDALIAKGRYEDAEQVLFGILTDIDQEAKFDTSTADVRKFSDQYVRLFSRLLLKPDYTISASSLYRFFFLKRSHALMCFASKARGGGFAWRVLGIPPKAKVGTIDRPTVLKLLAALSVNDLTSTLLSYIGQLSPNLRASACFGFLGESIFLTRQAEKNRASLSQMLAADKEWQFGKATAGNFVNVWMGCSYGAAEGKHEIKKALNAKVSAYLDRACCILPAERPARPTVKPTVVVMAEVYGDIHAMHRCYGPSIRALRDHFHVVLMVPRGEPARLPSSLADVVDVTPMDIKAPKAFFEKVSSYQPDILYFPSVGMRMSSIALANSRIAPIQIATNGHPATTHSPHVDYMILVDEVFGGEDCFSEKIILRQKAAHYVMRPDACKVPPEIRSSPDVVRIAVPAWIRKLSPIFLEVCEEIANRSDNDVEFHFFPNVNGVKLLALRRAIGQRLPARFFPRTGYKEYIERLSACDIHLSTFPFGSANGIVDAARQGLPLVNLLGKEPHARIDANLVNRLGQPDWLTATTVQDFIAAVVRLVDNHQERVSISRAILEADPDKCMLVPEGHVADDFGDIFKRIHRHHQKILAADKKVWRHADLIAMG